MNLCARSMNVNVRCASIHLLLSTPLLPPWSYPRKNAGVLPFELPSRWGLLALQTPSTGCAGRNDVPQAHRNTAAG